MRFGTPAASRCYWAVGQQFNHGVRGLHLNNLVLKANKITLLRLVGSEIFIDCGGMRRADLFGMPL